MKRTIFTLVTLLALTATYGIAQAASSSPSMSQTPSTSTTPSSQSTSTMAPANGDNQQILSQVQQQLSADTALKGVQATIDAKNVVTLQGTVGSKADRKRAKSMVAAVPGVKKVEDNVTVSAASATPSAGASTPAGTENTAGSIAGNTAASAGTASGSSSTVGNSGASSATSQSCPGGSCGTPAADSGSAGMSSPAAKGSADHQSDIQNAISQQITNSSITVQQSPTNIVLAGTVTTEADRVRAESIAKQYAGGVTVVNQINVSTSSPMAPPSGSNSRSDANVAPAASGAAPMTPAAAGQSPASGSMSSTSSSTDMQSQIQNALQQQGLSGVMVNVTDTSIALSGTVASSKDRTTAKRIAQSYAGNRKVTENLTVSGSGSPSSSTGTSGVGITPSPNNSGPGNSPNPNAGSNSTSTTPPDQNNPH